MPVPFAGRLIESAACRMACQVDRAPNGAPRFSGEFVQGPAGGKFVYVTSGTLAGHAESPWTRRAKVGLQELKWVVVGCAVSQSGSFLEARISGVARDGGPACASVPLLAAFLALTVGLVATAVGLDRDRAFYPTVTIVIASFTRCSRSWEHPRTCSRSSCWRARSSLGPRYRASGPPSGLW